MGNYTNEHDWFIMREGMGGGKMRVPRGFTVAM